MNNKGVKLLLSILMVSCMTTFAQDKTKNNDLIRNYNSWLKTIHLSELLEVSAVTLLTSDNLPGNPEEKKKGETLLLILKPAAGFKNPQEFATNWKYIKDGLRENSVNLDRLLWSKWADYQDVSPNQVLIEIRTADPTVFSWKAYYDSTLQVTEKINQVRGGEVSINYNFNDPGNLINNRYVLKQPITDLSRFFDPLASFFKKSKHPQESPVTVRIISSSKEIMMLEVVNVFGEATRKNYHEKIRLMVTINQAASPQTIEYWGTVLCAGGINRASEFVDAANEPDLKENLQLYNQAINQAFKVIFHENIQ